MQTPGFINAANAPIIFYIFKFICTFLHTYTYPVCNNSTILHIKDNISILINSKNKQGLLGVKSCKRNQKLCFIQKDKN